MSIDLLSYSQWEFEERRGEVRFVTVSVLEGMVNSDRWIVVLVVVGFGVVCG
jgi:hypothetical protein